MNESYWLRLRTLFARAAELSREEYGALLDTACAGEPELRADVESLLAYHSALAIGELGGDFLKSPLVRGVEAEATDDPPVSARREPTPPSHIGRYRILRRHGEGGMGIVYEAEQENPRRTVALKVIRSDLVSAELASRFKHEAQILARLQHPGIAQVHEAGMDEAGRPFFAMEFIRGVPLDEYARDPGLDTRARLELVARVCDAVQHSHDKGVVHRDLKPGNILVEESGQPKVLDFGVARVTAPDLLTTSSPTRTGQLLGTLNYMSPEQLGAHPSGLDGRSDVYTLGVVLFELLARRLPYHLDRLPMHEVARVIEQQEPTRLGSIDRAYCGDVQIIAGKALEKDRALRYASAGDLASDIRRYLRGEPILARPASALYQIRKFARRHTSLVAAVAGIFVALVAGTVVSVVFAMRAAENARVASERERDARYESYRARIAAASTAFSRHDVSETARHLGAAPEPLRGWEWRHLSSRLDTSTVVLTVPHDQRIYPVRSPEGIRIAVLSSTDLRLFDLQGNALSSTSFQANHNPVASATILTRRGGRQLCQERRESTGGPSSQGKPVESPSVAWLVDEGGRPETRLEGPEGTVALAMSVCPEGTRVAVLWDAGATHSVIVYNQDSGNPQTTLYRINPVWFLAFSPDGTRIATAAEDGITRLWDASTGKMTVECRGHTSKVLRVVFRPDGKRLLTTSADGTVRQWDPATGRQVELPYVRHTGEVTTAVYSPDGLRIASGGTDRTVCVWDARNQQDLAVLHGHTGAICDLAFTPDGRQIISASGALREEADHSARKWAVDPQGDPNLLRGHTSYVYPVAYSPDGLWIASGSWDKSVRLWDAETGETCAILTDGRFVHTLAFSPDSAWLVSGGRTGVLHIWDVASGQLQRTLRSPGSLIVQAIAVSPDGRNIAAADADGHASIMDATTGTVLHSFQVGATATKGSLAYSPDGRLLATAGEDATQIDLWDLRTYRRSTRLTGHTGFVYSIAFSGDGRHLASTGQDRTIRIWDVAASKCIAVLKGHTDSVFAVAFHPDGTRLASGCRDRAVWLWDLATGQEVARLEGHSNYVFSLAFSPDGTSLVSGSGDGTVRIWDTAPPARRQQARREAEALRPEAERLVEGLFREKKDAAVVAAAVRADRSLTEPRRKAALRAVLRRSALRDEAELR